LIGNSSGNPIEDNSIGGNANGLLLQVNTSGNLIRLNAIAGNPPSQFSKDYGASIGADVKDEATTNGARKTFDRNWCVTYLGLRRRVSSLRTAVGLAALAHVPDPSSR
jgi:parallel beta-helix repeat protein